MYTLERLYYVMSDMRRSEMFSIRQMIELTGLSEFTIRGWENRYQAFSPQRGETGRREYHKKDIKRALLIRELLKRGHKISKIASLSNQKLQTLVERFNDTYSSVKVDPEDKAVSEALELMALYKWEDLSDLFKNIKYKNVSDLLQSFFLPLIQSLATKIDLGLISIAQEHIVSSFLKEKIYSALSDLNKKKNKKINHKKIRFILAAPEGDYHEIGLLLAHLLLRSYGFTSLYLGPNTPAQDLSETALRFEASHLLIVSTVSKKDGAEQHLLNFINLLQKKMGPDLKILIAGSQAPPISSEHNSKLLSFGSFYDFKKYLQDVGGKLQSPIRKEVS